MTTQTIHPRAFQPRPGHAVWSEEQKLRIAGACLATLVRPGMTTEDLQDAVTLSWEATRLLERRGR